MTSLSKTLFGAVVAAGVAAFSGVNASAAIVCTGPVCWHTHEAYAICRTPASLFIPMIGDGAQRRITVGVSMKAVAIGTATAGWSGNRAVFEEQVLGVSLLGPGCSSPPGG